jgi:hypothetical protein
MRNLPSSLVIAFWFTGSIWFVATLVHVFGVDRHVLYATFALGLVAAIIEWRTSRSS